MWTCECTHRQNLAFRESDGTALNLFVEIWRQCRRAWCWNRNFYFYLHWFHVFIITKSLKCSKFSATALNKLLITRRFVTSAARTPNLFRISIVDKCSKKMPSILSRQFIKIHKFLVSAPKIRNSFAKNACLTHHYLTKHLLKCVSTEAKTKVVCAPKAAICVLFVLFKKARVSISTNVFILFCI